MMDMDLQHLASSIINSVLDKTGRAANMLWLSFVKEEVVYALNVQCGFRFIKDGKIIVASGDMYRPAKAFRGKYEEFVWDVQGNNLFDENVDQLLNIEKPKCIGVFIGNFNDTVITFENGMEIQICTDSSSEEEQWRLFE